MTIYTYNTVPKTNFSFLIVSIFTLSSTIYLAKLTSLSPVYLLQIFAVFLSFSWLCLMPIIRFSFDMVIALVLIFYVFINNLIPITPESINLVLGLMSYLFIRFLANSLFLNDIYRIFIVFFKFNVIILGADSLYRAFNPGVPSEAHLNAIAQNESLWFYFYKFNTLMFSDSNTTALIALVLIVAYFDLKIKSNMKLRLGVWYLLMIAILLSTFSRAAYVAFLFGYVIYFLKVNKDRYGVFCIIFSFFSAVIIFLLAVFFSNAFNVSDGSLQSKFEIIESIYEMFFLNDDLYFKLFGIGFDRYEDLIGISTHLLILTVLTAMGIIGLFIYIIFFMAYIRLSGLVFILPIILVSLSYFLYAGTPFLFVAMALVASASEKLKYEKNTICR